VLDADPATIVRMPEDSFVPLVASIVLTAAFVGLLLHWWLFAGACCWLLLLCLMVWLWPDPRLEQTAR
jgi:cytochrome c oxidase subunit I+III